METTDSTQRPPWIDPLLRAIVASIFEQSLFDGDLAEIKWSVVVEDDGCWCFDVFPRLVRGDRRGGHEEVEECPTVRCCSGATPTTEGRGSLANSCRATQTFTDGTGFAMTPAFANTISCRRVGSNIRPRRARRVCSSRHQREARAE